MSDKFSGDIDKRGSFLDYLIIILISAILIAFIIWANFTALDLVTTGQGKLIASGQNKNIQSPIKGTISGFFVEEGSTVAQDELIATINPTEAIANLEELQAKIDAQNIRLKRLDAELQKKNASELNAALSFEAPDLVEAEISLMVARLNTFEAEMETWAKKKERREKEIVGVNAELRGKRKLLELIDYELEEIIPLISIGAVSKSNRFELDRDKTALLTELDVLIEKKENLGIAIEEISKEMKALLEQNRTNILAERAKVIGMLSELSARLPAIEKRLQETEIKTPIAGRINVVFFNNVGAVVNTGEILAEVVPSGDNILIEAYIAPEDIATVEPGQNARISLTAFDAARYGYLFGKVTKVSPDTIFREETQDRRYALHVSINDTIYEDDGSAVLLVPGMVAQVDIIRGSRTILEYMWQPFAKIKDTAFRE